MRAAPNSIVFWNTEFSKTALFFCSGDRQSVIVVWNGRHVYFASCDKGDERNSEISVSLLSKRTCFLSKICVFQWYYVYSTKKAKAKQLKQTLKEKVKRR